MSVFAPSRTLSPDFVRTKSGLRREQIGTRKRDDLGRGTQILQAQVFIRAMGVCLQNGARTGAIENYRYPGGRIVARIGVEGNAERGYVQAEHLLGATLDRAGDTLRAGLRHQ